MSYVIRDISKGQINSKRAVKCFSSTRGPTCAYILGFSGLQISYWVLCQKTLGITFQDQLLHSLLGSLRNLKTPKVSARPQIEHPIEKQFRASVSQENTQQGQFHSKEMSQIEKYISSHTGLNLLSNYSHDWLTKTQLSISFTTKKGVWALY